MKKIWNAPITWGSLITVSALSAIPCYLYYLWMIYPAMRKKVAKKLEKMSVKICGKHSEEDEP